MKRFLVTRPEHDDTTYYLSKYCEGSIELTEKRV